MKISHSWLQEFVASGLSPEALQEKLLLLGFEVAAVQRVGPGFANVVSAQILDIRKHPNADRLSLCRVSDGTGEFSVVCGATNIQVGQKVPLARIGAKLPNGRLIQDTRIRGETSQGMLCSAEELGLAESDVNGIHLLDGTVSLGRDIADLLNLSDAILDVEITPNRPDCLSHYGLARELAAYLGLSLRSPWEGLDLAEEGESSVPVKILAPEACPRYVGRSLRAVRVGPSPGWLARRLIACGFRPINNVADVANYVLIELGHPLHAFDQDLLQGPEIRVRWASEGERLLGLDGKTHLLDGQTLVIADAQEPVALAGILGGSASSVTDKTRNVFLESAFFQPAIIRKAARRLGIKTESSYRFERGSDIAMAELAGRRAAELICRLSEPPARASRAHDEYVKKVPPVVIEAGEKDINGLLGTSFSPERIEGRLRAICPRLEKTPGGWRLPVETHRLDLTSAADLAEEVARFEGYQSVGSEPRTASAPPVTEEEGRYAALSRLRRHFASLGFSEAYNYDFVSKKDLSDCGYPESEIESSLVGLLNPLSSDWAFLRPTLYIGLLKNLVYNLDHGCADVRLFEVGHCYEKGPEGSERVIERRFLAAVLCGGYPSQFHWQKAKNRPLDVYDLKGFVSSVLPFDFEAGAQARGFLHPKISCRALWKGSAVGELGQMHPVAAQSWGIKMAVPRGHGPADLKAIWFFQIALDELLGEFSARRKMAPVDDLPASSRDLSLLVDEALAWRSLSDEIESVITDPAEPLVAAHLVDVYSGEKLPPQKKGWTLRLVFSRQDRTIKDEEVDESVVKILAKMSERFGIRLRE
ncbi:MAG: phenylalanine--tRNA ligase subunit beta [Elusimicrobia bacterium RIFCSPLOWO2_12_FULL_59_9]|nr:MAG: phenylalanine--tRNA ligase subunit beta [Elusimicrobia bacterium RIFCSPLOWO2_12_FULL_59_9]